MKVKVVVAVLAACGGVAIGLADRQPATQKGTALIELPAPKTEGGTALAQALATRKSVRRFTGQSLSLEQIAQICWAAQGISHPQGRRTAPSAGALYPLKLYVAMAEGVFVYVPGRHALERVDSADVRAAIAARDSGKWVASAGAIFVICGDMSITAAKYKDRAARFVWQETGHVGQNILLQAVALGLAGTPTGAFDEEAIGAILHLSKPWQAMYVLPVGVP